MAALTSLNDLNNDVLHIIFQHAVKLSDRKRGAASLASTSHRMNNVGRQHIFREIRFYGAYVVGRQVKRLQALNQIPESFQTLR